MKSRVLLRAVMSVTAAGTLVGTASGQQFGGATDQLMEHLRQSQSVDPNMTPIRGPGDYRFSLVWHRIGRTYFVHVPNGYRGGPMPMLIALHGEDGEGEFDQDSELVRKSNKAGFIVVSPDGYPLIAGAESSGGVRATWNAGRCCGPAQNHNADDVGFIREVISRVERQTKIDPQRIFATGYSNGAMMAWRLACESPEIRAIAPVAGTDNTTTCHPSHPVAVIEFHAMDDHDIPFAGGKGRQSIGRIEFTSVPASQAKWVDIDHADSAATRVLAVRGAHCDVHHAKAGGAPVELCVTDKGRHNWPGATNAIDADDLMRNFFLSL